MSITSLSSPDPAFIAGRFLSVLEAVTFALRAKGRRWDARANGALIIDISPTFTQAAIRGLPPCKRPEILEAHMGRLRKAGLPE